jgi:hypothetical protein
MWIKFWTIITNLGVNGATVLENCIGTVTCLSRLDLSENNLEAEMAGVMQGLVKNKSILSLNVSKNMNNIKAKHFGAVMESIVALIQVSLSANIRIINCYLMNQF